MAHRLEKPNAKPGGRLRLAAVSAAIIFVVQVANGQDSRPADFIPPSPTNSGNPAPDLQARPSNNVDDLWRDHPLSSVTASLKHTPGELPTRLSLPELFEQESHDQLLDIARPWFLTGCEWDAPATRHLPLMFEEPNIERLGFTYRYCVPGGDDGVYASECMQPLISGVHFFGRIPLLPYLLLQQNPCDPIYTLGVDRPGTPVTYRAHHLLHMRSSAKSQVDCDNGNDNSVP